MYTIWEYWNLCDTWNSLKIFVIVLFWFWYECSKIYTSKYLKQYVLISLVFLKSLNQNVLILFVNHIYIYWEQLGQFIHKNLISLWILLISLVWLLSLKCPNTPKSKKFPGGKISPNGQYPQFVYYTWLFVSLLVNIDFQFLWNVDTYMSLPYTN